MINSKFKWAALVAIAVTTLVACGGGSSSKPGNPVAGNTSASVTAANSAAISGKAFTFPAGVAEFGTTAATTLTITGTTFSIASGTGVATGDMSYASCIFTVKASTFPSILLTVGKQITIPTCTLNLSTAGVKADLSTQTVSAFLQLGAALSSRFDLLVQVSPGGVITIGGITFGTVVLTTGSSS